MKPGRELIAHAKIQEHKALCNSASDDFACSLSDDGTEQINESEARKKWQKLNPGVDFRIKSVKAALVALDIKFIDKK